MNDDIVDDASPRDSDAEKTSPSDVCMEYGRAVCSIVIVVNVVNVVPQSSEDDAEKDREAEKASGDDKTDKQEVRKRRPRKAD